MVSSPGLDDVGSRGLLIAAPSSGSGKTVLTLALLRALQKAGYSIRGAKAGPDYIDPAFHAMACDAPAFNLDPWAMRAEQIAGLVKANSSDLLLVEGMMGLFDGAADGSGSAADLAAMLGLPVVLVVDAAKQSHSIAALVRGFRDHRSDIRLAGVILNKVGSERHEALLRDALGQIGVPVLGVVRRDEALALPERHLGLVQAGETEGMETFIEGAARLIGGQCDLEGIARAFVPVVAGNPGPGRHVPPLGQRIAIARDEAFSFLYPHLLQGWREAGSEISFFSPLADEAPQADCDAVFLPGGYPELHGERLANANVFHVGLRDRVADNALVYGECGGYMALGEGLVDADGVLHRMAGLLPLITSFERRRLHLGYREITPVKAGPFRGKMRGHEFHYTSALKESGDALFDAKDALGNDLGSCGLRHGKVMGSYLHLIAEAVA